MENSPKESLLNYLYIKPYCYCCSYFNGLFAGYLIESGTWDKFKIHHNIQITTLIKKRKNILLLLITLCLFLFVNNVITLILALEKCLTSSMMSIYLCIFYLNNTLDNLVSGLMKIPSLKSITNLIRVSYVFHPLIFKFTSEILPYQKDKYILIIFHFIITMNINFFISKIIRIKIEEPIINYSKKISNVI